MPDKGKDNMLVGKTISRLLDFRGTQVATNGGAVGGKAAEQTVWDQTGDGPYPPRPVVDRARQRKMMALVPILSVVLLVVLNKFYGVPSFDTRWFRLETYRTMVGNLIDRSSETTTGGDRPVKLQVRGIVCSEELSSAVIGTAVVHEGDRASGATVVRINEDSVEFEMNGQTWVQKVQ